MDDKCGHHEQSFSSQKTFKNQVQELAQIIYEMGNPFNDDSPDLFALDTRDCTNECVVNTVRTIEEVGVTSYEAYVKSVIKDKTTSIHDPITKKSLPLFKRHTCKSSTKKSKQLSVLKIDCSLFSRLYIASQYREEDLEEFFKHEKQPYLPSLSEFGKLRFGKKI